MRTTLIFSCVFFISCAPALNSNGERYEPGFDEVCELTESLEARLLSDDFDAAGDEYSDGIVELLVTDRIQIDVVEAIWASAPLEMSEPFAAYEVWTDAAAARGNDEWECTSLLNVFQEQNRRHLAKVD